MSCRSRSIALLRLCRPLNCSITAASALVGGATAGSRLEACPPVLLAAVGAALLTGAGNAFNDLLDVDVDAVNRPDRPLPSGQLPRWAAAAAAALLAALGLVSATQVSDGHGAVAGLVCVALVVYSLWLKRTALWGNVVVAALGAAVFPFGALAAGAWGRSWVPAGLALLYHLGRELIKDMEDVPGDRAAAAATLPVRHGVALPRALATGALGLLVVFSWLPLLAGLYGRAYAVPIAVLSLVVLQVVSSMYRHPGAMAGGQLGRRLKAGMWLGLAAVLLGEWWR